MICLGNPTLMLFNLMQQSSQWDSTIPYNIKGCAKILTMKIQYFKFYQIYYSTRQFILGRADNLLIVY